jgi:hypothetical protein
MPKIITLGGQYYAVFVSGVCVSAILRFAGRDSWHAYRGDAYVGSVAHRDRAAAVSLLVN